jgi:FAD/FMN-containing dehydrogenase
VLGTGDVVARLSGLVKDNTGYDLAQLLCGSEGTLGIVTRARLRLVTPPREVVTGLLALPSVAATVVLAARLRASLPGVQALEVMTGEGIRLVADHLGVPVPVDPDAGAYLLVEVGSDEDPTDALAAAVGAAGDVSGVVSEAPPEVLDAAVATSRPERAKLWRFRESHTEAIATLGLVHKLDVTLPTGRFADFCAEVPARVAARWPGARTLLFGHVGDGNIHVNVVLPDEATAESADPADQVDRADQEGDELADLVLGLVVERSGSISSEHGIGAAKRRWLVRNRSASEVGAMRAVKHALDPDGILNPRALLP